MPDPTHSATRNRLLTDARVLADQLVDDASAAGEAVHTIVRATLTRPPIPAPELSRILEPLEQFLAELDQALRQLGGSLTHGADLFDLVDDHPDADPATVARLAADRLDDAATHAYRGSLQLGDARNTIAGQTYPAPAPVDRVEVTR
ncbi:hypothetical protein [Microlunatus ginsengisoli]|uniref:Uncharacterized protein n=1 Tax=Microlunatus ginsengisoli TaxID=363863 RepID=A0ABP6ZKQ9_9ACTN